MSARLQEHRVYEYSGSQQLLALGSTNSLLGIHVAVWPHGRRCPQEEERLQIKEDAGEMSCSQIDTLRRSASQTQPK